MFKIYASAIVGLVSTVTWLAGGSSPEPITQPNPTPKVESPVAPKPHNDIETEEAKQLNDSIKALVQVSKINLEASKNLAKGHETTHKKLESMDGKLDKLSSIDAKLGDIAHLLEHGHSHANDLDITPPVPGPANVDLNELKLKMLRYNPKKMSFRLADLDKLNMDELVLMDQLARIIDKAPNIGAPYKSTASYSAPTTKTTANPSLAGVRPKSLIPSKSSPSWDVLGSRAKARNIVALKNHLYNEHGHTDLNGLTIGQLWYIHDSDHNAGFQPGNGVRVKSNWFAKDINPGPPTGPDPPPGYDDCPGGVCPDGSYMFNGPIARGWRRIRGR